MDQVDICSGTIASAHHARNDTGRAARENANALRALHALANHTRPRSHIAGIAHMPSCHALNGIFRATDDVDLCNAITTSAHAKRNDTSGRSHARPVPLVPTGPMPTRLGQSATLRALLGCKIASH